MHLPDDSSHLNEGPIANTNLEDAELAAFEGIDEEKREQIVSSVLTIIQREFQGPLPPPDVLKQYADTIPDGANRIMVMAEKEQQHRQEMERSLVARQYFQSNVGQFLAFFIGITCIGAATYCIVNGFTWAGCLLGVGGITGLVTAFIKGKSGLGK